MIDRPVSDAPNQAITRRHILGIGASVAFAMPLAGARGDGRLRLIVGTYQAEGGGGLYPLSYDVARGRWSRGAPIPTIVNASFGTYSTRHRVHYLIDERADGTVAAYRADDWTPIGMASAGADPCHIAMDRRQRRIAVASYTGGSVAVFAIDPATGALTAPPVIRAATGSGPDLSRQSAPHAHWVGFSPDDDWLFSADLGADRIWGHDLRDGVGPAAIAFRAPPGSGPRHMVFHPHLSLAFLLCELSSQVIALERVGDGRFRSLQTVETAPAGIAVRNYPAELALNHAGDRLYVSNRGHDSIAVYAVARDGSLRLLEYVSTHGTWPRFFLLVEDAGRLLVANQRSGTIQAFAILPDGRLRPMQPPVAIPAPAFIALVA